jgi:hypothetical protein
MDQMDFAVPHVNFTAYNAGKKCTAQGEALLVAAAAYAHKQWGPRLRVWAREMKRGPDNLLLAGSERVSVGRLYSDYRGFLQGALDALPVPVCFTLDLLALSFPTV